MQYKFGKPIASAKLEGSREYPLIRGQVLFFQLPVGVLVRAEVSGLPDNDSGFFGFHIHEGANCDSPRFVGAGSHYSRAPQPHPKHQGDLPPLLAYYHSAYMAAITNRFSIDEIIGRTVVIHSKPDDFTSQPAGNSGERIACGVILKR